jgi:hypothetical protein
MPKIRVKLVRFFEIARRDTLQWGGEAQPPPPWREPLSHGFESPEDRIKDMLRYDVAFINDKYPGIIALPSWAGDAVRKPTLERWRSFNLILRAVDSTKIAEWRESFEGRPQEWRTHRHPRNADGVREYSRLEPITLRQILNARDWNEV